MNSNRLSFGFAFGKTNLLGLWALETRFQQQAVTLPLAGVCARMVEIPIPTIGRPIVWAFQCCVVNR